MLMARLVIFFPVVGRGCAMSVGRKFVEFGSSLVRVIWHGKLLSFSLPHEDPCIPLLIAGAVPEIATKNANGRRRCQPAA
jgi:hypothetical protein